MRKVGTSDSRRGERRLEGLLKVTGRAKYTDDLTRDGVLWAGFVESPYPHARIVSVDVEAARSLPGVHAVLTSADIGNARCGRYLLDWPILACGVTRFMGDRVVAVAAESPELVEQALELVDVEYTQLPAILDPMSATASGAPVLHPDSDSYRCVRGERRPTPHPNIQGQVLVANGDQDIERALASADLVVESHFTTPRQHHAFLEPHAALVWLDPDATVHVVSTNKAPFVLREQIAAALDLTPERIVVDNAYIGGDFGGKGLSVLEFALYFLAKATGRPVKACLPYANELSSMNTRHAASIRLRTGVTRDGQFLAHAAELLLDGGAYAAAKPVPHLIPPGALDTFSAYGVPHSRIEVTTAYTNTVPGGHMRSPGEVQAVFAGESHVDAIAHRLGMDPGELRRRNLIRAGDTSAAGRTVGRHSAGVVLAAAQSSIGWDDTRPAGHGVGLALYQRTEGRGRAGVVMRALPGGRFEVVTGAVDQGGGIHTALRRIAATILDVPEDRVDVLRGSTRAALFDTGVGSSRTTRVVGEATKRAATALRHRLDSEQAGDDPVEVSAEFDATGEASDSSFVAIAVEVSVDRETGSVRVIDAVIAVEVAEVVNPVAYRGQIEGGFVFGLGAALMEDLPVEQGQVLAGSLGEYKIPTIADVPPLRIVEVPADLEPDAPPRFKGVGELTNCGVPAAIANAVFAACGARVQQLPLTAERVRAELNRH